MNTKKLSIGLTPQREAFAQEYSRCGEATQAAKTAGYRHPAQQGSRLLKDQDILDRIKVLQFERGRRTGMTRDYVLEKFQRVLTTMEAIMDNDAHTIKERVAAANVMIRSLEGVCRVQGYDATTINEIIFKLLESGKFKFIKNKSGHYEVISGLELIA